MASRRLQVLSDAQPHPAYVVWELTLACDHACRHCGSRAVNAREDELTVAQALEVVEQLARMQTQEVVLIGGEAYLFNGFLEIIAALKRAGIRPSMTTGGLGITAELAQQMAQAGLHGCSVSIDGLQQTHDRMRAKPGSYQAAFEALANLRAAGIRTASNINVNRLNRDDLEPLFEALVEAQITAWQVQITAPLGRAADRPDLLLQPWDLLDLLPRIAQLKRSALEAGITMMPGNNLGYFGPEEALLRSLNEGGKDHWQGCQAGRFVMGIESDGAVKGCPSLQTSRYVGGNLRQRSLRSIWNDTEQLSFTRTRTVEDLWGFCRTCPFAQVCMGGCTFTAHAIFDRPGNNPFCHYRASQLAKQGLRERLVPMKKAVGRPFDNGRFDVVTEPLNAPDPQRPAEALVQLGRFPKRGAS